jgi:hypothetical protein
MLELNVHYRITFRDGIPRNYLITDFLMDTSGRFIYLITNEGEYLNHDNIVKFKKVEN